MTSPLNIIINPVKRWFTQYKVIPNPDDNNPNVKIFWCKDHLGNDVMIRETIATFKIAGLEDG